MTNGFADHPARWARWGGAAYLAIIALGLVGETGVRAALVVPGDAAATLARIAASPGLWRAGIAGDVLMHVLDVPVIVVLYLLLRPVSRPLAILATAFNLVQTAVLATNKLTLVAALVAALDGGAAMAGAGQLAVKLHGYGFAIGLVFFGFACLVRGALVVHAGFLPKVLGFLIALAGLCYLANSFALLVAPSIADAIFPAVLLPAFVGELALALWLLARGVDEDAWRRAAA